MERIGFVFTVQQGSSVVGTVVVGGKSFDYEPLELTTARPPESPSSLELAEAHG